MICLCEEGLKASVLVCRYVLPTSYSHNRSCNKRGTEDLLIVPNFVALGMNSRIKSHGVEKKKGYPCQGCLALIVL